MTTTAQKTARTACTVCTDMAAKLAEARRVGDYSRESDYRVMSDRHRRQAHEVTA